MVGFSLVLSSQICHSCDYTPENLKRTSVGRIRQHLFPWCALGLVFSTTEGAGSTKRAVLYDWHLETQIPTSRRNGTTKKKNPSLCMWNQISFPTRIEHRLGNWVQKESHGSKREECNLSHPLSFGWFWVIVEWSYVTYMRHDSSLTLRGTPALRGSDGAKGSFLQPQHGQARNSLEHMGLGPPTAIWEASARRCVYALNFVNVTAFHSVEVML